MAGFWEGFVGLVKEAGLLGALFSVFFLGVHYWLYRVYEKRVQELKDQIDRLAEENHEYRDRFMDRLDNAQNPNKDE